jgi:hypothetical protein
MAGLKISTHPSHDLGHSEYVRQVHSRFSTRY